MTCFRGLVNTNALVTPSMSGTQSITDQTKHYITHNGHRSVGVESEWNQNCGVAGVKGMIAERGNSLYITTCTVCLTAMTCVRIIVSELFEFVKRS